MSACNYEDDEYSYTFKQVDVEGNVFTVGPGGKYTVIFTNKLVKTAKVKPQINIIKNWLDWNDEPILPTNTNFPAGLQATFSKYALGVHELAINEDVDFFENTIDNFKQGGYTYHIIPISVVVTDEMGNNIFEVKEDNVLNFVDLHVIFTALMNKAYDITFTNAIGRVPDNPDPTNIIDKIPSKMHVDRWWDKHGILAYGASSSNDKDEYLIAFSKDFWEDNEKVTIGFGTQGSYEYIVEITLVYDDDDDDGHLVFTDKNGTEFEFLHEYFGGTLKYDNHYTTPKEKDHPFEISYGVLFKNPYGSGAKQMWLIKYDAAPAPLAAALALLEVELFEEEPAHATAPEVAEEEAAEEEAAGEEAVGEKAAEEEVAEEEAAEEEVAEEEVAEVVEVMEEVPPQAVEAPELE
jgi:hypothetical protein